MALLIQLLGAQRTLDIGVFTGYSSLVVARELPESGEVIACDINEEWCAIAQRYWEEAGVASKIKLHLKPALETLQDLLKQGQANSFDFAFIDADKEKYDGYYEACLQLLRPGALIAIDNVLWGGAVIDLKDQTPPTLAIRKLNQKISKDERVFISLIPIGDGLTLVRKLRD